MRGTRRPGGAAIFSPNHENPSPGNAAPPPPDVVPIAGPSPKTTPTPKDPIALLSRLLTPTLKPSSPLWSPQHRGPPYNTQLRRHRSPGVLELQGGRHRGEAVGQDPPQQGPAAPCGRGAAHGGATQRGAAPAAPPPLPQSQLWGASWSQSPSCGQEGNKVREQDCTPKPPPCCSPRKGRG